MAITATDRGTGTDSTNGTSLTINGVTMSVGSTGILCLAMDNAQSSANIAATSYTDSAGNIWYVRANRAEGTALANAEAAFLTAQITSAFSSSVTLTLTFTTTVPNKAWSWIEASTNVANAMVIWRYATNAACIGTAQSSTSTPTSGLTTCSTGDLAVGMIATENPDILSAGDSDTSGGSWSTAQHTGVGSGTSGISIYTQTKVVTVYTDQTYNITLTGSVDSRGGAITLSEVDNKARVLYGNTTGESSSTIPISLPITAGSMCVLAVAADNLGSGGNTPAQPTGTSVTDSKSNTWTQRITGICDPAAAAAGVEISMYTGAITTGLGVADTLTFPFTTVSPASKVFVIYEFAPAVGGNSITYVSGSFGNNSGATPTTAPQVTTSSITNNNWVIAMTGAEAQDDITGDSDTTNGTWRQQSTRANGAVATAMCAAVQAKQVTATATQSYDATFLASTDWATGWISLNDSSPTGGLTASQKAAFFQMF